MKSEELPMNTETKPGSAVDKPVRPAFITLCGRAFYSDPQWYPRSEYHGRTIFFCTTVCMDAFNADPDRFYKAHRASHGKKDK